MRHHTHWIVVLIALGIVWLFSCFKESCLWIRFGGRDTELCVGYGEFYISSIHVPETHFDFEMRVDQSDPSLKEMILGMKPYPTFAFNQPGVIDGFGIPFWNIALVFALYAMASRAKKGLERRGRQDA